MRNAGEFRLQTIRGYVTPQVQFEVRLPTQNWNRRYLQAREEDVESQLFFDTVRDHYQLLHILHVFIKPYHAVNKGECQVLLFLTISGSIG
jgi:hypothetical protein